MILKPETVAEILSIVDPEDFYWAGHREIAIAIRDMRANNIPVDEVTVVTRLRDTGRLRIVGDGFVTGMMDQCAIISNYAQYAASVRDKAVLRTLAAEALRIHAECYQPQTTPMELLERTGVMARDLTVIAGRGQGTSLKQVARDIQLARLNPVAVTAPTGLKWLDQQVGGGFRPGQLIYLGARSGSGKSVLACQVAIASIRAGKRVLYASLEMPRDEVLERLACTHGDVNYVAYTLGTSSDQAMSRLNLAMVDLISSKLLTVVDRAAMTVMDLEAVAVSCRAEVVIADYVQLMAGPRGQRFNGPRERVEAVSRDLKGMAMQLKVPVISPCQLSRASATDNRRPVMTDLREAGGLENDADGIIFVWRPQYTNAQATPEERAKGEIIIGKLRRLPFGQSHPVRLGPSGFEEGE
jgi:replicative DNA helicase